MPVFGWSVQQIAFAKQRYATIEKRELDKTMESILELRAWWDIRRWPEPLSIVLADIEPDLDINWAATAMHDAAVRSAIPPMPSPFGGSK